MRKDRASRAQRDLTIRFGCGHLKDHGSPCPACNGTGLDLEDGVTESEPCLECESADETGLVRWGSYYVQDVGECCTCKRDDMPIAAMYEGQGMEDGYVCLPCWLAHHVSECGCKLWERAERAGLGLCAAIPLSREVA